MSTTQELVHKHFTRNFSCHLLDGGFWGAGFAALGLYTIMPGLIHEIAMRHPAIAPYQNRLATLSGVCFFGLSQWIGFFVAGIYETKSRRLPAFLFGAAMQRVAFFIIAPATFFMDHIGYGPYLVLLFFALSWYGVASGFVGPLWIDFVGRLVPVNRRGILLGSRDALATVMSVSVLALFPVLGRHFSFPHNYGIMYTISWALFGCSWIALFFFKEIPYAREDLKPRTPFSRQVRENLSILRDDIAFRKLIIVFSVLAFAGLGNLSLITMRAMERMSLSGVAAAKFTGLVAMTVTIANAVSILTFGYLGDRWGYKRIAFVAYGSLFLGFCTAIFASSTIAFEAAVVLSGVAGAGMTVFGINFPLEFAPENRRPTYMALRSLCGAPFIVLPFVGGWIADTLGGATVFGIACFCIVAGLIVLALCVSDPRRHVPPAIVSPDRELAAD
jgi:MFS family permease